MKSLLLCAALLANVLPASAADLKIVRIFTGWHDAASFKHIAEYFTGRENTHGEAMLRTHPDQRGGYYFLLRTANPGPPVAVRFKVNLIAPTEPKLRTFSFPADLGSGETVLNLGLTGADWPDPQANPVAWKLEIVNADGRVLASKESYLWEKPVNP